MSAQVSAPTTRGVVAATTAGAAGGHHDQMEEAAEGGLQEEQPECWICRDRSSPEPLVQPCACRGSMSGVHASCVERWVAHQQSASTTGNGSEVPRCSVCKQPYQGTMQRPGVGAFMWQLCRRASFVLRQLVLWLVLCDAYVLSCDCYTPQAEPKDTENIWESLMVTTPKPLRFALAAVFVASASYTLLVLCVSLPPMELPPQHWLTRAFFVPPLWRLLRHVADAAIFMLVLLNRFAGGSLCATHLLPFIALAAVPYAKCLWHVAGLRRNRLGQGHQLAHCCWLAAVCVPRLVLKLLPRDCHLLGPCPHIATAVLVIYLCSTASPWGSWELLVAIFAAHGGLAGLGFLEVVTCRRLPWQKDTRWALAMLLALCGFFSAEGVLTCDAAQAVGSAGAGEAGNSTRPTPGPAAEGGGAAGGAAAGEAGIQICVPWGIFESSGNWPCSSPCLLAAALAWLLAVSSLAVAVNWAICVRVFRIWQRRHGTFALQMPAEDTPPELQDAPPELQATGYVALPGSP